MTRTNLSNFAATVAPAALALVALVPGLASAAARAELRPSRDLAIDTPAQLVITVDEADATRPPAPKIRGADVEHLGQMAQTTVVNGKATTETSFIYSLVPRAAGTLDIPAIQVGDDITAPIRATVAATPRPARGAQVYGPGAGRAASGAPTTAPAVREPTRAYVRLDAPARTLVVGEAVPVTIRAYFRAGVAATLQGPPRLSSPAFTLSGLSDEPTQREVEIDGTPYLQATWTAVVSAAKPTTDKLAIELPVEIAYRERRAVPRPSVRDLLGDDPFGAGFGAMFDDPFFGGDPFAGMESMFDVGPTRQQTLTLRHTAPRVRVAELPTDGQPAGFTGAVGTFEVALERPPAQLRVGEPVTLTFRVTGEGNLDRVSLAGVPASPEWKTYGVEATTDAKTSTKTFTQTIVPTRDGELVIPAVSLAYYDPTARAYRTASTAAAPVDVAPAPGGGAADPGLATASVRDARMAPTRAAQGETHATLAPMIQSGWFWLLPAGLVAATLVGLGLTWSRDSDRVRGWLGRRRLGRALDEHEARLDTAVRNADSVAFFDAARSAFQVRLAAAWGVAPETITATDVAQRLGDRGAPIRDVLEQADRLEYAPGAMPPITLDRWHAIVRDQLAQLEASR